MSTITKTPAPACAFTMVPNGSFCDPRLAGSRLHVWGLYREQADGYELSPEQAAARLRVSLSTVKRALADLERDGLIERTRTRRPDGSWGSTGYKILGIHDMPRIAAQKPSQGPQRGSEPPQRPAQTQVIHRRQPVADDGSTCTACGNAQQCSSQPQRGSEPPQDGATTSDGPQTRSLEPQPSGEPSLHTRRSDLQDEHTVGDVRRTPDVSGEPGRSGRPAASHSAKARPRASAIRRALAGLPFALAAMLPELLPRSVHDALDEALATASPEQLAERIDRRWTTHGYEAADPLIGGCGIHRPVGVLLTLIKPGTCPNPGCEDGIDLLRGGRCPRCDERAADVAIERGQAARARPQEAHGRTAAQPPALPARPRPLPVCAEHPGAASRAGQCAGCWADRQSAARELLDA